MSDLAKAQVASAEAQKEEAKMAFEARKAEATIRAESELRLLEKRLAVEEQHESGS